jgi:hypothetical protein
MNYHNIPGTNQQPSQLSLCDPGLINLFGDLPETTELVSLVEQRLRSSCQLLVTQLSAGRPLAPTKSELRQISASALRCVLSPENERVDAINRLTQSLDSRILTPLIVEERTQLMLILTGLRSLQGESNPYLALDSPFLATSVEGAPFAQLVKTLKRRYFALLGAIRFPLVSPKTSISLASDFIVEQIFLGDIFSGDTEDGFTGNSDTCSHLRSLGLPLQELVAYDQETVNLLQISDRTAGSAAAWHSVLPSETARAILANKG